MKICAACCEELPRESFSKTQWKLKEHQRRRCINCNVANRNLQLQDTEEINNIADDESADEEAGHEDDPPELDKHTWLRIKAGDPAVTSVCISWDSTDVNDFVNSIEWEKEGHHVDLMFTLKK